jgi:adenylate cyclase
MAATAGSALVSRRNLRLASGLTLFSYAGLHLVNHALGLHSLAAAEAMLAVAVRVWSSVPGTVVLYGAAAVHVGLALLALYERRTLRMPPVEALRYVLGFAIPLLLIGHVFATRVVTGMGGSPTYERIVWQIFEGDRAWRQFALVALAWTHGAIGITLWLRHRDWFARASHALLALAVLLPALALAGFVAMGRELDARADDPAFVQAQAAHRADLDAAQRSKLEADRDGALVTFLLLVAGVVAARGARRVVNSRRRQLITLRYPEAEVRVTRGYTVLEASRAAGIAHLSLCGGRARCSTCRVRVAPATGLPPPGPDEAATLARIHAPRDVRLACQLRPEADLDVAPVFASDGSHAPPGRASVEREVVVLFTDLRRWTGLAERALPFDLVYVQNQFYAAVGDAVAAAGGLPNQFVGDSVMAIFGLECEFAEACRQSLEAVRGIEARMREVNQRMQRQFAHALDFGVGLNAGPAVIGDVGWRDTRTISAVGDTVNTAARLQELTKTYAVRLVLADAVATGAGLPVDTLSAKEIEVRGRRAPLTVYAVATADALPVARESSV